MLRVGGPLADLGAQEDPRPFAVVVFHGRRRRAAELVRFTSPEQADESESDEQPLFVAVRRGFREEQQEAQETENGEQNREIAPFGLGPVKLLPIGRGDERTDEATDPLADGFVADRGVPTIRFADGVLEHLLASNLLGLPL